MTRVALLIALLAVFGCKEAGTPATVAPNDGTGLGETFAYDSLVIENEAGERLNFDVYLALTPEQQRRGLMFIRHLPERTGMLFVYDEPRILSIWMKNTYIPLDLLFVDADGRVESIVHNATPLSLDSRPSKWPAKYVLELNGGSAIRFNIGTRSRLIWEGDDALNK